MNKQKVYEKMVKNGKELANQAKHDANQKIKILKNICVKSQNYDVIEDSMKRIARLEALKHDITMYTPEDANTVWRLRYLFNTIRDIEKIC